jgi:hypothetical protein
MYIYSTQKRKKIGIHIGISYIYQGEAGRSNKRDREYGIGTQVSKKGERITSLTFLKMATSNQL